MHTRIWRTANHLLALSGTRLGWVWCSASRTRYPLTISSGSSSIGATTVLARDGPDHGRGDLGCWAVGSFGGGRRAGAASGAAVTSNGKVTDGTEPLVAWWAFASTCTTSGFVATPAELDPANPAEASETSTVLRLVDGLWAAPSKSSR